MSGSAMLAQAATYYVNDGSTTGDVYTSAVGSNSNSGTASAPFLTINYAIGVASAGDKIMIDAGTYLENVVISKRLNLTGAGNTTIITASSACFFNSGTIGIVVNSANSSINKLKVTNFDKGIVVQAANLSINYVESVYNCNHAVGMGNGASGMVVKHSKMNNNNSGFRVGTSQQMKKIRIDSSEVMYNTYGILVFATSSGNMFDTINIYHNDFSYNTQKGMYFEKLSNAVIDANIMESSGTDAGYAFNNGIDINLSHGSYSNIQISNNYFNNCGAIGSSTVAGDPAVIAVKGRDDGSNGGSLNNVSITNNFIRGPRNGIRLGSVGLSSAYPTNVNINNNNIGGSTYANKALLNESTNSGVNATCNRFGSANPSVIAGYVSGSFVTSPALLSGTDASAARGFQPVTINLSVSAGPDKTVYFGYAPLASTTLSATVSGGSGFYTYSWSPGGATTPSITVAPSSNTTYTVTVTDVRGCVNSNPDAATVFVVDVRCNPTGFVKVCTGANRDTCITAKNAKYFIPPLGTGHMGECVLPKKGMSSKKAEASGQLTVYPNPSTGVVNISMPFGYAEQTILITNSVGQLVYSSTTTNREVVVDLGELQRGLYVVEVSSAEGRKVSKLMLN